MLNGRTLLKFSSRTPYSPPRCDESKTELDLVCCLGSQLVACWSVTVRPPWRYRVGVQATESEGSRVWRYAPTF